MDLRQEWYQLEAEAAGDEMRHRPVNEENAFWHAVSVGDLEYVRRDFKKRKFMDTIRGGGIGVLSRNPVTNLKYHLVISTALITRVCVEAGMEMEQAFRLSDFYILKMDNLHTVPAIEELHEQMVLDFTGKMQLLAQKPGTSKAIAECIEYVYAHIQTRITVEDLAACAGLSPSHLSRLFKKETGISVSDYIREKKVEKAQELLCYSNFSLIEIANTLSFSSQSHFTQVFRAFTGVTPKKYRDTHGGMPPLVDRDTPPAGVPADPAPPEQF